MRGMFEGCSSLVSVTIGEKGGSILSTERSTGLPEGVGNMR